MAAAKKRLKRKIAARPHVRSQHRKSLAGTIESRGHRRKSSRGTSAPRRLRHTAARGRTTAHRRRGNSIKGRSETHRKSHNAIRGRPKALLRYRTSQLGSPETRKHRRISIKRKFNAHKRNRHYGKYQNWKLRGSAAAVVCVPAHPGLLQNALRPLQKLPLSEIVAVVLGEPNPEIHAAAVSLPNVRTVFLPNEQDDCRGRAAGAALVQADAVLFTGGKNPGTPARLASFLRACRRGTDVALNHITPQLGTFHQWERVFRMAAFLNLALNRRDLGANTLQVLPFALSRRAIQMLGPEIFTTPLKAHAAAIQRGLRVRPGGYVPLSAAAKADLALHTDNRQYAAAWQEVLQHRDHRLSFPDRIRRRSVLTGGLIANVQGGIV